MQSLLRFLALANAAIWLGAAVAVSFVVLPVVFSPAVTPGLIPKFHAGRIAELVLNRHFALQLACASLALTYLFVERFALGRPVSRRSVAVLAGLLILGAVGRFWLAPKMERLHSEKYDVKATATQREAAARQFSAWHGTSQVANLVMLAGVLFHFWRTVNTPAPSRTLVMGRVGR